MARVFRLDPVRVLNEPDEFAWAVRVAAYNIVAADAKAAAPKPK